MMLDIIKSIDMYFYGLLETIQSPSLDVFFKYIKFLGDGYIVLLPFFIFMYLKGNLKKSLIHYIILSLTLTTIKIVCQKYRPEMLPLYGYDFFSSWSMEKGKMSAISGDVVNVLFMGYYLKNCIHKYLLLSVIILVSIGRMYSHGHYIIDVLLAYIIFHIISLFMNKDIL